ncbi:MAG: endonuclease III domain-containing protein [bacterium]
MRRGAGTALAHDRELLDLYARLRAHFGHRNWWPARTRFEIVVGAILTQNTAWRNVEHAIANLRAARVLSVAGIRRIETAELARLVRPSGYFNQKAERLKAFVRFLDAHAAGSLSALARHEPTRLREALLSVKGIGPETADSILLYALEVPVFVVDAYTRRVVERHRLIPPGETYESIRAYFEERLPRDLGLWNDFHAQIVAAGHHFCGTTPRCDGCPLQALLPPEGAR